MKSPKLPSTDPSPRLPPRPPAAAIIRPARRAKGSDWIHTFPGPRSRAKKRAFAGREHRADAADRHQVEIDARGIGGKAAGIDVQLLTGAQLALDHGAAHLDEHPAVAVELLHDEALAAEQAGHHLALERDADRHALRRGEKAVLLTDQRAAELVEPDRQDRAGGGAGERDARLARSVVREDGGEQALARHQPLARAEQFAHEAAVRAARSVAEHRRHPDRGVLPDQRAGLRHRAFAGVEFDLDELELLSLNLEVDVVGNAGAALVAPGAGVHCVFSRQIVLPARPASSVT